MHSSPFSSLSSYDLLFVCVMIPYAATVGEDELELAAVSDSEELVATEDKSPQQKTGALASSSTVVFAAMDRTGNDLTAIVSGRFWNLGPLVSKFN